MFEGGFLIKDKNRQGEVYERLRLKGHIPISAYIDNTKKSLIVFNTPSCWDCHGWKLGEFLAMGKAIISTPITNELPYPLIHRQNIYIINSKEELYKAVDLLIEDHALRTSLAYIIHSGFISGYQNRYGDNLKPPTNVYHRMTA